MSDGDGAKPKGEKRKKPEKKGKDKKSVAAASSSSTSTESKFSEKLMELYLNEVKRVTEKEGCDATLREAASELHSHPISRYVKYAYFQSDNKDREECVTVLGLHSGATAATVRDLLLWDLAPLWRARGSQLSFKQNVERREGGRLRQEVKRIADKYRR